MASGRPDWFGTIVAAGKYDTTFIPIALDVDGFITATIKGACDSVLKTIAVDSSGVMKANISVQDADFLTVRPAYGKAEALHDTQYISPSTTYTVVNIPGRGVVLFGWIQTILTTNGNQEEIELLVDGSSLFVTTIREVRDYGFFHPHSGLMYILKYDDPGENWVAGISPGLTFETSLQIKIKGSYIGITPLYIWEIFYALVP